MDDRVNLEQKISLLDEPYAPGIVGYMNDYKLAVVKIRGEFIWHQHGTTDDFFLVLRGHLTIQLRDRTVELDEGELLVVPRGVEHCPKADKEAHVLLIEPRGTLNTGDTGVSAPPRKSRSRLETPPDAELLCGAVEHPKKLTRMHASRCARGG